jgi:hypothetical protein
MQKILLIERVDNCRNPSFKLTTKAKVCKGAGQDKAWESHFMLPGMQKSVRE